MLWKLLTSKNGVDSYSDAFPIHIITVHIGYVIRNFSFAAVFVMNRMIIVFSDIDGKLMNLELNASE